MPDILIDRQDPHFTSTLSYQDRQKLRAVVKKVHFAHYTTETPDRPRGRGIEGRPAEDS